MKEPTKVIIEVIKGFSYIQALIMLFIGKVRFSVILVLIALILTIIKRLPKSTITPRNGKERACKYYIIIVSIVFAVIYSIYTYYFFDNGVGPTKLVVPAILYSVIISLSKFIEPVYTRKLSIVPFGVTIAIGIEVYVMSILSVLHGSTLEVIFSILALHIMIIVNYCIPLGLSVLAGAFLHSDVFID